MTSLSKKMFVTLWDVADFWSKTSECYHFTTFFQDNVIGQRQPPTKYERQPSSVAQDAAVGTTTTIKPGDKVSTDMHYCLTYFRIQQYFI